MIALRYNTQQRFDVLSTLVYEICSDMEFCAHEPLVRGECFSEGGEIVHSLMVENAPTEQVLDSLESKLLSLYVPIPKSLPIHYCLASSLPNTILRVS